MELTLAEELLLLALDDKKGSSGFVSVEPGLAGALLVDLGRIGALRVVEKKGTFATDELEPVPDVTPEHPVLARALSVVAEDKRRSAASWVGRLPGELTPIVGTVAAPLVERGILDEDRRKFLGLIPDTRYREVDPGPERNLRARLRAVLVDGAEPEPRDALLVGLLVPLELVAGVVDKPDRSAAKARAKAIADQGVAGDAVRDAVAAAVMAAIMPAIFISTTTVINS